MPTSKTKQSSKYFYQFCTVRLNGINTINYPASPRVPEYPWYPWTLRVMGSDSPLVTSNTRSDISAGYPRNAHRGKSLTVFNTPYWGRGDDPHRSTKGSRPTDDRRRRRATERQPNDRRRRTQPHTTQFNPSTPNQTVSSAERLSICGKPTDRQAAGGEPNPTQHPTRPSAPVNNRVYVKATPKIILRRRLYCCRSLRHKMILERDIGKVSLFPVVYETLPPTRRASLAHNYSQT